ncbi:MAG TPA: diguanylate cyclase [Syntrophales bacterium]|nr:diguanylate cyclase [Syntrophales bacterium]
MKQILIISDDFVLASDVEKLLLQRYSTRIFPNIQAALDSIYESVPNLVVVEMKKGDPETEILVRNLKEEPLFSQLPILAILQGGYESREWDGLLIDDFIRKEDIKQEMSARADLCVSRSERIVEINPLTRLPGNITIQRQIQDRLDRNESFALAYADIDFFKPFNDKYGFGRGDEVLRITGRIILNMVKNMRSRRSFVGHIGGDDFIYILETDLIERVSMEIVKAFDEIIPTFYDSEDRQRGFIQSRDRQGNRLDFPFMCLSVGITDTMAGPFRHYGEMTEAATDMKKYAKQSRDSCYKIDQRRSAS